ncbi:D-2-hydroxyacid dehydrogenase [Acerihabitans sp.]|uniref:D-2-hydroxyacid dehydrogenase n=1 Tax=Acerihabitans sp. TaxID=2811394 RepID=UPI002ED98316
MKIVILDGGVLNPGDLSWTRLEQLGEIQVYENSAPEEVVERIGRAEIAIVNKVSLGRKEFERCPELRFIGVTATGYNNIDLAAAGNQGIAVANVPTYGTVTVAQFTTSLMLELCNHVGEHALDVRAGGWSRKTDFCYWLKPMIEVADKSVGIIGFGRIGQAFGMVAQALGMKVLAYDEHRDLSLENERVRYVDLDTLYAQADIISLHCLLTGKTQGMINAAAIGKMKKSVLILNASRGDLVNEADLAAALNSGRVAGAAVDVLSQEPPSPDNPLLSARNCLVTPHIAWASVEARGRILAITADNVKAFINGHPQNRVDTL